MTQTNESRKSELTNKEVVFCDELTQCVKTMTSFLSQKNPFSPKFQKLETSEKIASFEGRRYGLRHNKRTKTVKQALAQLILLHSTDNTNLGMDLY